MNNEFEGKKRIGSPKEFEERVENNEKDFSNCVFMFAFENSGRLISALTNKNFNFHGAIFSEEVTFKGIFIDNPINISGAKFKKPVIFDSVNFNGDFVIKNCTFNEIEFSNVTCEKSVLFNHVGFTDNADDTLISIHFCTFHDFELLFSSSIVTLTLSNNNFLGKFEVSQNYYQKQKNKASNEEIGKVKIEKLYFGDNQIATGKLVRFEYLDVDYFHFENMNNPINSDINIGECDFNTFVINNVRNAGRFKIYRINANFPQFKKFELTDSYLGNGELQDVNLKCYKQVYIRDSLPSDLTYIGVQWPRTKNIQHKGMDTDEKKRDTYRTLKNVVQKNNDAPRAIVFYAKEMDAYSRTLSWGKGPFFDKFILKFNRWTNNFGLTWWLPIIWILGFGALLYACLLYSLGMNIDDILICKHWTTFPVFLNPTHKTGFVYGQWGLLAYSIDLFFRVIEAALIYQTIIAFKKFTRKL